MTQTSAPGRLIWALGATQIIGYGTLYYAFSILAPDMAREFSVPVEQIFGLLSLALLIGAFFAPKAGGWADRYGAGRLMAPGSLAAGLALALAAMAPNILVLGSALVAMQIASIFVLYSTAFAALVQVGGAMARRSITHLTLIAGFASTLFWPLTAALHDHLSWRSLYLIFAALNILVCLPIHLWVRRLPPARTAEPLAPGVLAEGPPIAPPASADAGRTIFLIMLFAFCIEGFVLASILVHMVPMITALGLGTAGLMVSTLFGPSQVASRLLNMMFGGRLSQLMLAVISAGLLVSALCVLLLSGSWIPGVIVFAVLFGLGSGLASIVGGTLPLELFGKKGYGARLGWVTASRQFSTAAAPFAFALMMQSWGLDLALTAGILAAALAVAAFTGIAVLKGRSVRPRSPSSGPAEYEA
ncbi:arsenite efflux MFS transporter ArsK [Pararhizobium antarcticum]|uniref:MFS transporter n=1 Tax=Pararhizobium antarcticum TaxID=1798805 RepID=A0A657LQ58_9HYPH|nr:arsenite efflux MFS transporter ArsK [Pararhizobium antarcticum]OJF93318.1 MFS transporter [Pararhizobium antarcticum]OJF93836.1 MFS transporter [Rhizobium sp. 58]